MALCTALQTLYLLLRLLLEFHQLLHSIRRLLLEEILLLHFFAEKILSGQHLFDVLLVCVGRVLLDAVGVAEAGRLLLQTDTLFVEFKIFVFELLDLDGLIVVLLDFGHELVFQVHAEFTLLLECLLEKLVVALQLSCCVKLLGNALLVQQFSILLRRRISSVLLLICYVIVFRHYCQQ